jgi:hypothetical protein
MRLYPGHAQCSRSGRCAGFSSYSVLDARLTHHRTPVSRHSALRRFPQPDAVLTACWPKPGDAHVAVPCSVMFSTVLAPRCSWMTTHTLWLAPSGRPSVTISASVFSQRSSCFGAAPGRLQRTSSDASRAPSRQGFSDEAPRARPSNLPCRMDVVTLGHFRLFGLGAPLRAWTFFFLLATTCRCWSS